MTADGATGGPVGVVLAAGRGSRFGDTKQVARVDGRALVGLAVDPLAEFGLPVLVVVGHDADRVTAQVPDQVAGRPVRVTVNPDPGRGQGSSLAAAARAAGRRDLVVVLGDQPGIARDDVARVCAALRDGAVATRIVHDDGPGHPVGLSSTLHDRLVDLERDQAGRELLATLDVVELPADGPRPVDVDTPADLARARDVRGGWTSGS